MFAESMQSMLDECRVVSIAGVKGAGKTAMAFELAEYYLRKGYGFYSNIQNVWNDNLYSEVMITPKHTVVTAEDGGLLPDVYHKVLILDEGGRYLREWKYFENLFEFTRKTDNYLLIPSTRIAHQNLQEYLLIPWLPLYQFYLPGTIWEWRYDNGTSSPYHDFFWHMPGRSIGVYDTQDISFTTTSIINAFTEFLDLYARIDFGRDGIQSVESIGGAADTEFQQAIAQRLSRDAATLYNSGPRRR